MKIFGTIQCLMTNLHSSPTCPACCWNDGNVSESGPLLPSDIIWVSYCMFSESLLQNPRMAGPYSVHFSPPPCGSTSAKSTCGSSPLELARGCSSLLWGEVTRAPNPSSQSISIYSEIMPSCAAVPNNLKGSMLFVR